MPRSLKIHPSHKPAILQALTRNGFLTQGALAGHLGMALSTVNNFINSRPVYLSNVEIICDALGLNPADLIHPITTQPEDQPDTATHPSLTFSSYDGAWVGREETVQCLSQLLQESTRLLLILGLTGIGKTALAERLILENQSSMEDFQRVNLEGLPSADFASVALQWLQGWNVPLSTHDYQPEQLLQHLLQYLQEHRVFLLFDSLEVLLVPDEDSYGGQFQDPHWSAFFQGFLAAPQCPSRILITSQELPEQVVQQRYSIFRCYAVHFDPPKSPLKRGTFTAPLFKGGLGGSFPTVPHYRAKRCIARRSPVALGCPRCDRSWNI